MLNEVVFSRSRPTEPCRKDFVRGPGGATSPVAHSCAKRGLALVSRSMKVSQTGSPTWRP